MIELALDALSNRPLLGAQVARGCGEVTGSFDVMQGGVLLKKISIGGFSAATVVDFRAAGAVKLSA